MIIRLLISAFIFLSLTTSYANTVESVSTKYDSGVNASVAKHGNVVVAVSSSGYYNTLWYKVGLIKDNNIEWGKSYHYDNGLNGSVAIKGNTVVAVHKSKSYDTLWYRVGIIDSNTKTISWGDAQLYDKGQIASVAITEDNLVEVHQLTEKHLDHCADECQRVCDENGDCRDECSENCYYFYTHNLIYRTGIINNRSKIIQWTNAKQYAQGKNPSIALSGKTLVETHESTDTSNLWSQVGTLQGNTIQWEWTANYDKGLSPSVTMEGDLLVELHKSQSYNRLWYHVGKFDSVSRRIIWGQIAFIRARSGTYNSLT